MAAELMRNEKIMTSSYSFFHCGQGIGGKVARREEGVRL